MNPKKTDQVVNRIIKRYGPVLDLRANPGVMIDILRQFGGPLFDDNPCGGVPPQPPPPPPKPPPPPSPSKVGERVSNEEILTAVLKLAREVNAVKKSLAASKSRRA